jgi:beta-lactamase regulating signal transducer with metallopeptidase domain
MNHLLMSIGALIDRVQPLLLDAMLKGTALLILTMIVVGALRKDSAARRHLAWLSALIALLFLPAWSALLPGWRILPRWPAVRSPVAVFSGENAQSGIPLHQPLVPAPAPADTTMVRMVASPPAPAETSFNVPECLALMWAAGFAFLLMRMLAAHYLLRRTGSGSTLVTRGRFPEMVELLVRQLGIRQPVQLLFDSRRTIPMVFGVHRPRLLLPAQAVEWDDSRLRVVLLHELAHVQRRDTAGQWLTQFVCAMYWCNPLVWFAARRIQVERERACDDVVLAGGAPAAEYAEHLLYVATKLSLPKGADAGGLAMARPSQLETRLAGVLDERMNRRNVARPLVVAALILTLGGVIPLAMLLPKESLTAEEARRIAVQLANAKVFTVYRCEPFGSGRPARFEQGRWVWIGLQGYGAGDIQATVEVAANGSTNAVNLEFLYNIVLSKGF